MTYIIPVVVVDASVGDIDSGEAPVHAEVHGDQQQVVAKHVNLLGPPFHTRKSVVLSRGELGYSCTK